VVELLAGRAWGLRDAGDCEGKEGGGDGMRGEALTAGRQGLRLWGRMETARRQRENDGRMWRRDSGVACATLRVFNTLCLCVRVLSTFQAERAAG